MKTFVLFCFAVLLLAMSITLIIISFVLFDEVYNNYKANNSNHNNTRGVG